MGAALRIVRDVVAYRLSNLEMANLAGALSIALALRRPAAEVAARFVFAFLLNVLVYLNNDTLDVSLDLRASDRSPETAGFLAENLPSARAAQAVLLAVLVALAAAWDRGLFLPLVLGGGACLLYSTMLKRRPFLDVAAMIAWGTAMPLCGTPIDDPLGWAMALQLGLYAGVFECLQVLRDAPEDAAQGVQTTAVALGHERTVKLARAIMATASAWTLGVLGIAPAALSAYSIVVPVEPGEASRAWTRVKVIYGVAWLAICAIAWHYGRSAGMFVSVPGARLASGLVP